MPEEDYKVEEGDELGGVYSEEGREKLVEEDEIEGWEEGFMEGADMDGQLGKCANCGDMINERCEEKEIEGKLRRFCCKSCIENYEEKHEQ